MLASTSIFVKTACRSGIWQNHQCSHRNMTSISTPLLRRFCNNKRRQPFASSSSSSGSKQQIKTHKQTWYQNWTAPVEIPPRNTFKWYGEMTLLCTVFAITGSSTMFLVRPAMNDILGLNGSMKDGPWSYRLCSIVIMTPIYPILLVCTGTLFGRHAYFRHFAVKMFSRFGIPAELMDKNFKANAKGFRKW